VCAHIPGQGQEDDDGDYDDGDHNDEGRDVIAEEVDQAAAAVAAAVLEAGAGAGRFMNRLDGVVATALSGPSESEFEVVEPASPAGASGGGVSADGAANGMVAKESGLVAARIGSGGDDNEEWPLKRVRALCDLGVVVLTPQELVKALLLSSSSKTNASHSPCSSSSSSSGSSSGGSGGGLDLPWMVLDLRDGDPNGSNEDGASDNRSSSSGSGGGSSREPSRHLALAKSLRLSPDVVEERPAQLEVWLQHFDAMKGTPLCLVDSCGEVLAQSFALTPSTSGQVGGGSVAGAGSSNGGNGSNLFQRFGIGGNGSSTDQTRRDSHGRVQGPAILLASVLAAQGFPSVAVLGGSFDELVHEVQTQNGTGRLEPLIIDLCAGAVAQDGDNEGDPRNAAAGSPMSPGGTGKSSGSAPGAGFLSPFSSSSGGSSRRSSVSSLVNTGRALVGSGQKGDQKMKIKHLQSPGEDALIRQISFALRGAEARGHNTAAVLLRKALGVEQPLATTGELVQVNRRRRRRR